MVPTLLLAVAIGQPAQPAIEPAPPVAGFAMPAPRGGAEKFSRSDVVVTGKVTAIEKDTVEASSAYPGAKDKVTYKVAVVKIDTALSGAKEVTHIKIGFIPPAPAPAPADPTKPVIRPRPFPQIELKEGQEMLFYLVKHPTADFYVMPMMNPPTDVKADAGKKELEAAKKFSAVVADPMKALKAEKAADRAEAAALLVVKYRTPGEFTQNSEQVAIDKDESKLILKALAEGDWSTNVPFNAAVPSGYQTFFRLGLTDKDGWKNPQPVANMDYGALMKEAFTKWLDGPGKDYQIKKVVAKKAEK